MILEVEYWDNPLNCWKTKAAKSVRLGGTREPLFVPFLPVSMLQLQYH